MEFRRPGDANGPGKGEQLLLHRRGDQLFDEKKKQELLFALERHNNVVIHGPIGSQLALRIPVHLVEAGWAAKGQSIIVSMPRKVSVISAALSVARKRGLDESYVGGEYVGYVIDSNVKRSSATKVVFFNNRALLQTILCEPLLNSGAVVVITDFQERGITVDLLLGLLKGIQRIRSDLRIIVTTTSLDVEDICLYLGTAHTSVVSMPCVQYTVNVLHAKAPVEDYHESALQVVKDSFSNWNRAGRPKGTDILVFVKGAEETEALCDKVNNWYSEDVGVEKKRVRSNSTLQQHVSTSRNGALVRAVPLHASLTLHDQMMALESNFSERYMRVVIATNIAEMHVTVDGISTVIDCGFERLTVYNSMTKTPVLSTVPISRSSAHLRASRAGLIGPGTCIRLYTDKFTTTEMANCRLPEVLRSELTEMVLAVKAIGLPSVLSFDFITPPKEELIVDAMERLYYLGALTESAQLASPIGLRMTTSRLSPQIMKSLIIGESFGVGRAIAAAAAMLEIKEMVFKSGRRLEKSRAPFAVAEGDVITLLNVWRRYIDSGRSDSWCTQHCLNARAMRKAARVFSDIVRSQKPWTKQGAESMGARKALGLSTEECVCRSIAAGFFENAAMVEPNGSYLVALSGKRVVMHRRSVLRHRMPRWVVYIGLTQNGDVCEMSEVTVVKAEWIAEYAPQLFELTGGQKNS